MVFPCQSHSGHIFDANYAGMTTNLCLNDDSADNPHESRVPPKAGSSILFELSSAQQSPFEDWQENYFEPDRPLLEAASGPWSCEGLSLTP